MRSIYPSKFLLNGYMQPNRDRWTQELVKQVKIGRKTIFFLFIKTNMFYNLKNKEIVSLLFENEDKNGKY